MNWKVYVFLFITAVAIFYFKPAGINVNLGGAPVKPTIKFQDSDIVLNANDAGGVVGTLEFFSEGNLGKNIDIKINWKNGAGFKQSNVDAIIIKRNVGGSYLNVSDGPDPTEMKLTDSKYFEDFSSNGVEILGKFLSDDQNVVGDNEMEVFYTTVDDTTQKSLGTNTVKIDQNHLDTTVDLKEVEVISIPPTSGGVVAELAIKEFTTYNITSNSRKRIVANTVRMETMSDGSVKLKDTAGEQVSLPGTPENGTYIFKKYLDSFYFIQNKGSDKFLTDDKLLHAVALIRKDQKDIFNSAVNLEKALFTITPAKLPKARYVWIGKMKDVPKNQRKTDLMEVMIHDKNGVNIAKGIKPQSKPGFDAYDGHGVVSANISDENYSTPWYIAQDRTSDENEGQQGWIKFDLGEEKEVKSVTLVSRKLYESRMEGVGIKLFNGEDAEIMKTSMLTTAEAQKNSFVTYDFTKGTWATPPRAVGITNFFNKFRNEHKFEASNNLCGYYKWESTMKIACDMPYGKGDVRNLDWELRKDFGPSVKDPADTEFAILRADKVCGVTNTDDEINCTSSNKEGWEAFDIVEHEHFPGYYKIQPKRGPDNAKHYCYMNANGIISCSARSDAPVRGGGSPEDAPPLTDSRTAFKFGDVIDLSKGARRKEDNKIYVCANGKTAGCNNSQGQGVGSPNHSVCVNGNYVYCY